MFYLGWVADYNDADNFLYWLFHTKQWGSPGNHTRYTNPKVDALLDQARASTDHAARVKIYHEVEALIVKDLPWVLLYCKKNYFLVQPYLRNVKPQFNRMDVSPSLGYVDLGRVYYSMD